MLDTHTHTHIHAHIHTNIHSRSFTWQDEKRGTNLLLTADVSFSTITTQRIGGTTDPEKGFSSFKVVPGTAGQHLLAIKSKEVAGSLESFLTVVNAATGDVLLDDIKVADNKLEGVEFV